MGIPGGKSRKSYLILNVAESVLTVTMITTTFGFLDLSQVSPGCCSGSPSPVLVLLPDGDGTDPSSLLRTKSPGAQTLVSTPPQEVPRALNWDSMDFHGVGT